MIEPTPLLTRRERRALITLLERVLAADEPPILRAILFGSKARGDFDDASDIDLLLICDLPPDDREEAGRTLSRDARIVSRELGLQIETWAVAAADLDEGWRTPMLVDAIEDGITLWPRGEPPLHLPFTPADARFCAGCLLDWVEAGETIIEAALAEGRWEIAAGRARDDITRLAAAALLLIGETRHRRITSLSTFAERFIYSGITSRAVLPALEWAAVAYPPGGGRGTERPPPSPTAVRSADTGLLLSRAMAEETIPLLHYLIRRGSSEVSSSVEGGPPASIRNNPIRWAMKM